MTRNRWFWLAILLILAATAALRIRLLQTPLERDEGEYAYAGQLMLQGIPPYLHAANMKLPGTYAAYAVLMAVFGQTIGGIHLGLLVVNAIAIVLIALIGERLFGAASGIAAAAAYALMSLGFSVLGTQAHATHFVVAAALGGFLLLLRYADAPRASVLVASGLLLGLAFVMKQHGIIFCACGFLWLCVIEWRGRRAGPVTRLLIFGLAMGAPFAVTCLLLWRAGVFPKFWFWTFSYARAYATEAPLAEGLLNLRDVLPWLVTENATLWILGFAGLAVVWLKRDQRGAAAFLSLFLLFSALSVCPGLYFRPHYFIMLLPAVALLAGATVRGKKSLGLFVAAWLISVVTQREFLFESEPHEVSLEMYGANLFLEAIPVAAYIREHSERNARIAVLGSEPEIYFYAGRISATEYIYTYGLMEQQPYAATMQEEMIQEITDNAPEFIVFANAQSSWIRRPASFGRIFDWWKDYAAQHYVRIGVVSRTEEGSESLWGPEAEAHQSVNGNLAVYRRRPF